MDWLTKMNSAMDYIEAHLAQEIDMQEVCRRALCSSYNFQRMFSFITDVPLMEYIRRRRLTAAALELRSGQSRVVDVALKYGYESAAAFARAFCSLHGVTPSEARLPGVRLKAYPRITFTMSIKGEKAMEYRIETKEAVDVFGIETIGSLSGDPAYLSPKDLWDQCKADGRYQQLLADAGKSSGFLPEGMCSVQAVECYRPTPEGTFPYMICAFMAPDSKPEGYRRLHIPAQTYVVFSSGPFDWREGMLDALHQLHKRFYAEWLPTAPYERAEGPNFEIYGGTAEYGEIELWYPIVPKEIEG